MGQIVGWAVVLMAMLSGCLASPDTGLEPDPGYRALEHCCWQWMRAPDLPVASAAAACTTYQDEAWLLGGIGARRGAISDTQSYSLDAGWTKHVALPRAVSHATGVVANERLQVVGGYEAGEETPTDRVYERLPVGGTWYPPARLPDPLAEARAVMVGQQAFLVGGTQDGEVAAADVYGWRGLQGWQDMGDLATPRAGGAFAVRDGATLVAAAGWLETGDPPLAGVDAQDLTGTAVTQWFDVPTPRTGAAAAQWDDRLFLIGGTDGSGEVSDAVEFLDLDQEVWFRVEPQAPLAVTDACALVMEDGLHLLGGSGTDGRAMASHWVLQPLL